MNNRLYPALRERQLLPKPREKGVEEEHGQKKKAAFRCKSGKLPRNN